MLKHAMLSTAALVFLTDSAVAQTTTTQSTTVTAPSAIAPAPGRQVHQSRGARSKATATRWIPPRPPMAAPTGARANPPPR